MRRKDREVVCKEWMLSVLEECEYLQLALCREGVPYVVPMNYGIGDGYLVLHGAAEGQKIDFLKSNPRAAFSAVAGAEIIRHPHDPSSYSSKYRCVCGSGTVRFLTDIGEKREALELLMKHYNGPTSPMPDAMLQKLSVMRLDIEEMTGKVNGYENPDK